MRAIVATVLIFAAWPAFAGDAIYPPVDAETREVIISSLGALSIAPQICGMTIDRAELDKAGHMLLPEEPELSVEMFRINNLLAREYRNWTSDQRLLFCDGTAKVAVELGLLP